MSAYTRQYAQALRMLRAKGSPITFTLIPRTQNATTRTVTAGTPVTVSGYAARVQGDPKEYERLGLVEAEPLTLEFVAVPFGDEVPLDALTTWMDAPRRVAKVSPTAPDGPHIVSRVVVAS